MLKSSTIAIFWYLVTLFILVTGICVVSESHKTLFECLVNPLLPSHHAFVLLRSSVLPRLSYLSRVVPPEVLLPAAEWFDSSVRSTFSKRLRDPPLSADMSLRISLPIRFGGFGLRPVVRVSPIAYACSLASAAFDIVQLHVPASPSPSSSSSASPPFFFLVPSPR